MKKLDQKLLNRHLEETLSANFAEGNVGGASLYVSQAGECLYHKHFGLTGVTDGNPIDDRTIYRMASMTKPVSAVAAMILVDRGLLRLDDFVDSYLPEYAEMNVARLEGEDVRIVGTAKNRLRILHLLTHSSGIGSGPLGTVQNQHLPQDAVDTLDDSVAYFANAPLAFDPYSAQAYSDFAAFDVLTKIIELVSGEDYETFLKKNLFLPLGMKDTGFIPSEDQWNRMIGMHDREDGKSICRTMPKGCIFTRFPCTHFLGGAGLFSTLPDYIRFAEMLQNGGALDGNRILSQEAVHAIGSQQVPDSIMRGYERWGLAVRVIVGENWLPRGSFGWSGAYGTHFWIDPENRISAIYLRNSLYDSRGCGSIGFAFEKDVCASLI
ncbi:MAG: serine hydrolase [Clostridia bacterium]|nr:serine hydrolase [Clostridia bacterium]